MSLLDFTLNNNIGCIEISKDKNNAVFINIVE